MNKVEGWILPGSETYKTMVIVRGGIGPDSQAGQWSRIRSQKPTRPPQTLNLVECTTLNKNILNKAGSIGCPYNKNFDPYFYWTQNLSSGGL